MEILDGVAMDIAISNVARDTGIPESDIRRFVDILGKKVMDCDDIIVILWNVIGSVDAYNYITNEGDIYEQD